MTAINATSAVSSAAPRENDRVRLLSAVRQLQSVFVEQLLKAMRETVPDDGVVGRSQGEDVFSSMLDQKLSSIVPESWRNSGLESALLRQLHGTASPAPSIAPPTAPSDPTRPR